MTSTSTDTRPGHRRADPLWVGSAVAVFVVVVVLRGLSRAGYLTDGPLHLWYVQVGICGAGVAAWSLVYWLVRQAYRRGR